jgi:hypothetical protein
MWGLDRHIDLADPHATTTNVTKIPPRNRAIMVVDREVADKEMAAKGTLPIKGVMRTGG